jgi:hypothetical protein
MARKRQGTRKTKRSSRPAATKRETGVNPKSSKGEEAAPGGAKEAAVAVGKKAAKGAVKGAAKELLGKDK